MRHAIVLLLCAALAEVGAAQGEPEQIARIRALHQRTEANKSKYHFVQVDHEDLGLESQSVQGASVQAWCDGNDLRLVEDGDSGESWGKSVDFYFDHDSLFFAFYREGRLEEPIRANKHRWHWDEERLYFTNGRLIRQIVNGRMSGGSPAREKAVLAEAERYRRMMAGCTPHARPPEKSRGEQNAAESVADQIAKIRAMYQRIVANKARYRVAQIAREELAIENRSIDGGIVAAFCDGSELPFIYTEDDGEMSSGRASLYYDHDSLFFAMYENGSRGRLSDGWTWHPERLYFANGKLIRRIAGSDRDTSSYDMNIRAREVLVEAEQYHRLMAECKPHPRTPDLTTAPPNSIALHEEIYAIIQRELPTYRQVSVPKPDAVTLDAYCAEGELRIIVIHHNGAADRYYYDRSNIFLAIIQDQRFYFTDDSLVRWVGPDSVPRDLSSPDAFRQRDRLVESSRNYRDSWVCRY